MYGLEYCIGDLGGIRIELDNIPRSDSFRSADFTPPVVKPKINLMPRTVTIQHTSSEALVHHPKVSRGCECAAYCVMPEQPLASNCKTELPCPPTWLGHKLTASWLALLHESFCVPPDGATDVVVLLAPCCPRYRPSSSFGEGLCICRWAQACIGVDVGIRIIGLDIGIMLQIRATSKIARQIMSTQNS